jgi:hypothetical protein
MTKLQQIIQVAIDQALDDGNHSAVSKLRALDVEEISNKPHFTWRVLDNDGTGEVSYYLDTESWYFFLYEKNGDEWSLNNVWPLDANTAHIILTSGNSINRFRHFLGIEGEG